MTHGTLIPLALPDLEAALLKTSGSIRGAARLLGVNRQTLRHHMTRNGLLDWAARLRLEKEGKRLGVVFQKEPGPR